MTVNRTTLLDLPLPVTGTESGTWGDTTNNGLTQYLDIAIAGTLVLSTDADVTLTSTEGDSSATNIGATTAQYAILRWTATGSTTRNITALAQSKTYVVINATGGTQSIVLRGAGPTTGVTIISGEKAHCVWNGSDFVKVSSSAAAGGSNTQVQYNSSGVLAGSSNLTFDGTSLTLGGNPTLSAGTANGVLYLNGSKVATSGSALTFDGSNLALGMSALAARVMTVRGRAAFVAPSNDSQLAIYSDGTTNGIYSTYNSGGSYLPMTFYTSDVERYRIGTDGTAIWTIGSEQMRLTSTGLGIGTSSPSQKLHLSVASGSVYSQITSGTNQMYMGYANGIGGTLQSNNLLAFYTGASYTQNMVLDSSGNLGLGVTPSANAGLRTLYVSGYNGNYSAIGLGASGSGYGCVGYNLGFTSTDGTIKALTSDGMSWIRFQNGAFQFFQQSSATAGTNYTGTQAMTLDASGNLGVGTSSPASILSVSAASPTITLTATTTTGTTIGNKNNRLVLLSDSSTVGNGGEIVFGATDTNIDRWGAISGAIQTNSASGATGDILFATKASDAATSLSERARITSGGDLLVGTTSAGGGYANALSTFQTTGSTRGAQILINDAGDNQWVQWLWNKGTSGNNLFVEFGTEASYTGRGSITYNRAGGLVAYNTTSDYRAKDIIGPVTNSGEVIDSLKVYEGKMKGATQSRPMLVAHEAQAHAPYAVTGEKDAFNEDGTPKFQQIDVSSLVPLLLAEIQSLRQRVALLEGN